MGTFYDTYSECIHYNNVVNEILPFDQEVLCMTLDNSWFHIRKKHNAFYGVTRNIF